MPPPRYKFRGPSIENIQLYTILSPRRINSFPLFISNFIEDPVILGVRGCRIICCIPYFRIENVTWNDDSIFVCNLRVCKSVFLFVEREYIQLSLIIYLIN